MLEQEITLPKPFTNDDYTVVLTVGVQKGEYDFAFFTNTFTYVYRRTSSSFIIGLTIDGDYARPIGGVADVHWLAFA